MPQGWDWKHTMLTLCGLGSVVCVGLAQYSQAGALPFHVSAGLLGVGTMVFGYLSKQLGGAS